MPPAPAPGSDAAYLEALGTQIAAGVAAYRGEQETSFAQQDLR